MSVGSRRKPLDFSLLGESWKDPCLKVTRGAW